LCSLPPEKLAAALKSLGEDDLAAIGTDQTFGPFRTLCSTGCSISSFGQFQAEQRIQIQKFLEKTLGAVPANGGTEELDDFVSFIRAHPGRIYQENSAKHHALLLGVLLSPNYVIIQRSAIERFTAHRYFTNRWERAVPLIGFDDKGGESELRPRGAEEYSRFRSNAFAYLDSHGLSISTGGIAEGSESHKNLAYEMGVALAIDDSAKLGNWFASDFEKILRDAVALNPASAAEHILPGEVFHETCQNPRDSSSISKTQHIQISRGSTSLWPIMRLQAKPLHVPELGATLDVVQVGNELDAFMVCLESYDLATTPIIEMLHELRLALYRLFGPTIDFVLLTSPRGDGMIRAAFAPVAVIKSSTEANQKVNALDEGLAEYCLPVPTVDSSQGKGNVVVSIPEGWQQALEGSAMLSRLYDFNRLPGTRKFVSEFLRERYAYEDDVCGRCKYVTQALILNGDADPPPDVFFRME
jgi:hypothetical protein